MNHRGAGARDSCVVPTGPLAALLTAFVADWQRERPNHAHSSFQTGGGHSIGAVGPVRYLAAETGLPIGTIQSIRRGASRNTELRVADPLVTALGHPEAFHDGTLPVIPNPSASRAARASCCSGSTGLGSLTGT